MTPTEKAHETRKKHKLAQLAKHREEIRIRETLKKSCLTILDDPGTTPEQRLEVTKMLYYLKEGR